MINYNQTWNIVCAGNNRSPIYDYLLPLHVRLLNLVERRNQRNVIQSNIIKQNTTGLMNYSLQTMALQVTFSGINMLLLNHEADI